MKRNYNWLGLCAMTIPLLLGLAGCNRGSDSGSSGPVAIEVITNATELATARKEWTDDRESKLKNYLMDPDAVLPFHREALKLLREHHQRSVTTLTSLRDAASTPATVRIQASRALNLLGVAPSADQLVQWANTDTEATLELLSELRMDNGLYSNDEPLPEVIKSFVVACVASPEARVRNEAVHLAAWRGIPEAGQSLTQMIQKQSKPDLGLLKPAARLCPSPEVLRQLEQELKVTSVLTGNGVLGAIADLVQATTNAALKEAAVAICVRHLKQLRDEPFIDGDTIMAIGAIAKGLPPEKAAVALSDVVRSGKWQSMRESALDQLHEIQPALALELARETKLKLNPPAAETNKKPKPTANELAAACVRHGVLAQSEADAALRALTNSVKNDDNFAPGSDSAEGLLYAAGRFVAFDVETGECPNRHDLLIEDFARISSGRFQPQAILERYEEPKARSKGWLQTGKGKYTVQFIVGDRLYRFAPKDLGDWYDVESVIAAIHQALGDAGVVERFVALESGGQDAAFIFAKPEPLLAAAAELGLKLGTDLDQARKQGKAFEERALKDLRE